MQNHNLHFQRKLEINEWIIAMRWFYMAAVFLLGILSNSLIGLFLKKYSFFSIGLLLLVFVVINYYFFYVLSEVKKKKSDKILKYLSLGQIGVELLIFSLILQLGGEKSIASLFFFLPIISSAIIYGVRGAVITALLSGAIVNISIVAEYFFFVTNNIMDQNIFSLLELSELKYLTINLIKIITTSNFYLVMAIFAGYGFKFIFQREKELITHTELLLHEKEQKKEKIEKLNQNAMFLAQHEENLQKKVIELEKFQKSMLRAFNDLTKERKRTEDEKDKTEAIISNFIDPIIVIDNENKISVINPAAQEIFGFIKADIGKSVSIKNNYSFENFRDITKQDFEVKKAKELKSNNPREEEVIVKLGKKEFIFKVITAEVTDKMNEHLGIMKIFYNLTREKMIDKLKSEFISIAAHQLRTPLSAIKWSIKMVLDGDTGKINEEAKKMLFKGFQSNERIIQLVNDMLNVSRIDEGRFGYNFERGKIIDVVKSVIESLEGTIKQKDIKFSVKASKRIPLIDLDPNKMRLAVENLIENAIKYTPEHGTIEIGVEATKSFIKVRVKDNGVGIPEADQEKMFSKFFRADNVIRMQTEGSGLGLFIVKNIINKHGGEITFDSEEGKGTEFVFTLPIK